MNCYECIHRGNVPGSTHSSCNVIKKIYAPEHATAVVEMGLVAGMGKLTTQDNKPAVDLDEHGVRKGWAAWPMDFDPIWVKSCIFFESNKTT